MPDAYSIPAWAWVPIVLVGSFFALVLAFRRIRARTCLLGHDWLRVKDSETQKDDMVALGVAQRYGDGSIGEVHSWGVESDMICMRCEQLDLRLTRAISNAKRTRARQNELAEVVMEVREL